MYSEDWLLRQINMALRIIVNLLLGERAAEFESSGELSAKAGPLYDEVFALAAQGRVNEAENLIFDRLDTEDSGALLVASEFYSELNRMGDEALAAVSFSREEIYEGIADICREFGVEIGFSK